MKCWDHIYSANVCELQNLSESPQNVGIGCWAFGSIEWNIGRFSSFGLFKMKWDTLGHFWSMRPNSRCSGPQDNFRSILKLSNTVCNSLKLAVCRSSVVHPETECLEQWTVVHRQCSGRPGARQSMATACNCPLAPTTLGLMEKLPKNYSKQCDSKWLFCTPC